MDRKTSSRRKKGVKASRIRKKISRGAKSTEVVYHSTKEIKVERALIENFISLQKVMVNLSAKFDNLSNHISKLLELFEISAKALAKRELSSSGELETRKVMEKLDNISKQAGLIGKGLALIHEVGTENERPIIPLTPKNRGIQFPTPAPVSQSSFSIANPERKMTNELSSFKKSLFTKSRELKDSIEEKKFEKAV